MALYPRVVYMITHNITNRMYIGSTGRFKRRIQIHLNALRSGRHPVEDMQKDFDEYGENYSIQIIDELEIGDDRKEYDLMDLYGSRIRGVGYNYKDNHARLREDSISMYPNFRAEVARKKLTLEKLKKALEDRGYKITLSTLSQKLSGKAILTLDEAILLKSILGVDIPIEILFEEAE